MINCRLIDKISTEIKDAGKNYDFQSHAIKFILITPIVLIIAQSVLWVFPRTRRMSMWMLNENHPVELMTFLTLLLAAYLGLKLALKAGEDDRTKIVSGFYICFSLGLFLVAMEEVAWGQWLFWFKTPEFWRTLNMQGETTIHNIKGLQGYSEILRLFYGVSGLIGVWCFFHPNFRGIGVPVILLPWFIIIVLHASIDVYNDFVPIEKQFDHFFQKTSELIELYVAFSAFLYIELNHRRLRIQKIAFRK